MVCSWFWGGQFMICSWFVFWGGGVMICLWFWGEVFMILLLVVYGLGVVFSSKPYKYACLGDSTVVFKLITDRHFFCGELISNYRYRIRLPEELISIGETDLWELEQKIAHYRYSFSLEFQLLSITATDIRLQN